MHDFNRLNQLSAKITHLLEAVKRNHDQFTSIDKELLAGYTRELYELVLAIEVNRGATNGTPVINVKESIPEYLPKTNGSHLVEESKHERETIAKSEEKSNNGSENIPKKSIAEWYAEQQDQRTLNEKYKRQNAELADKLKQTPIKDLKGYIGLNKRFSFINLLFNGDEAIYEEALENINTARNYEEAMLYVQTQLVKPLQWRANDSLVADFFNLILRRYLN